MSQSFEAQLAYGQEGEHIVAEWLIDKGTAVVPLYQFTNHGSAPFVLWDDRGEPIKATLPDLQCYQNGKAFMAEVKRKRQWWYGEHTETGVDIRLWNQYRNVRSKTGAPVYLCFLQEEKPPTGLFVGEVMELEAKGPRHWTEGTQLVFFRHEWLKKCADLEDLRTFA